MNLQKTLMRAQRILRDPEVTRSFIDTFFTEESSVTLGYLQETYYLLLILQTLKTNMFKMWKRSEKEEEEFEVKYWGETDHGRVETAEESVSVEGEAPPVTGCQD